jgi:MFS transporter, DHA1 family, multidrug resistance protein
MVGVALAFGLVSPNAMHGATELSPDAAGAASAVAVFLQMGGAALASDLVARFFDGRSALSMATVMLGCSLAAAAAHAGLTRPADRRSPAPFPSPARQHGETA